MRVSEILKKNISLIISSVALVVTFTNNCNQNKKWETLNLGNVQLKDVHFMNYREITGDELKQMNWGYRVICTSNSQDFLFRDNKLLVPNCMSGYNTLTHQFTEYPETITFLEAQTFLRKKGNYDSLHTQILKHYKIYLILYNSGNTDIKILSSSIFFTDSTSGNTIERNLNDEISRLEPKRETLSFFSLDAPLALNLPSGFNLKIDYADINNDRHHMAASFTFDENGWRIIQY